MQQGNQNYDKVDEREVQRRDGREQELLCVLIECEPIKSHVLSLRDLPQLFHT